MGRKKTTEEFIIDAKKIHSDKYNYSLVDYKNNKTKVKIICPIHGVFEQQPNKHTLRSGCPKCSKSHKKSTEEFIIGAKKIHSDKYDYSLVDYNGCLNHIKIICPIHGAFEQQPTYHLYGQGCPKCSNNTRSTSLEFIKMAKKVHNDKYDYSLVDYKNNHNIIRISCPIHGVFEQRPNSHLNGSGCKFCIGKKLTSLEFIKKSKKIHGDKYDYSLVDYIISSIKVKILCSKHGHFQQLPTNHLLGHGCPSCNESRGEKEIRIYLEKNNIHFNQQQRFKDCKNIKQLPFDFYLPEYNTCIEYDGIQHTRSIDFFGGEKAFIKLQKRDKIKNEYCIKNNIHLLRINHNENIEQVLTSKIKTPTF